MLKRTIKILPNEMLNKIGSYLKSIDHCNFFEALLDGEINAPRTFINTACNDCDGKCRIFCTKCARHIHREYCFFCKTPPSMRRTCIRCNGCYYDSVLSKVVGWNSCYSCAKDIIVHKSRCTPTPTAPLLGGSFYRISDLRDVTYKPGFAEMYICETCSRLMHRKTYYKNSGLKICNRCGLDQYTTKTKAKLIYKFKDKHLMKLKPMIIRLPRKNITLYHTEDVKAMKRIIEEQCTKK